MIMKKLFKIEVPEKRNFGLDLLRFIAIFTVLVSHSITVLPSKFQIIHFFITDGVLIFFVLSGFLIGRILIRDFQDGISLHKVFYFWKRRWFRTLPAYVFTIFLIITLSYLYHVHFNKFEVLKTIFFVQNIFHAPKYFFTESWSLSIEEWFYLTLPILLFIFLKISKLSIKINIIILFILILILSNLIRTYYFININVTSITVWDDNFRKPIITRLDSILIGVLGSWFYIYKKDFFTKNMNLFFIMGLSIFLCNKIYFDHFVKDFNFYVSVIYFSLIPFSILLMIPFFYNMHQPKNRLLNNIITYGSLISYSLYLLNSTVIIGFILNYLHLNPAFKFVLFWILNPCLSILMYKYVEQPFLKLRDKSV